MEAPPEAPRAQRVLPSAAATKSYSVVGRRSCPPRRALPRSHMAVHMQ